MSLGFHPEIIDYLRAEGLHVIEVAGWQTRGSEKFDPVGSVNHHTAGPATGNHPSLGTLINGRGGSKPVPGPLCNFSMARNLDVYMIAAGRANHAGTGSWQGTTGNSRMWGLEVEHTGVLATEPYPSPEKWDVMHRIHAAAAKCSGFDSSMVCQHFEWTTRKIDFIKAKPGEFRTSVQGYIDRATGEDEDMKLSFVQDPWTGWHAVFGNTRYYLGPNGQGLVNQWLYIDPNQQNISVVGRDKASFADLVLNTSRDLGKAPEGLVADITAAVTDALTPIIEGAAGGGSDGPSAPEIGVVVKGVIENALNSTRLTL